jgi:hypothetical protein
MLCVGGRQDTRPVCCRRIPDHANATSMVSHVYSRTSILDELELAAANAGNESAPFTFRKSKNGSVGIFGVANGYAAAHLCGLDARSRVAQAAPVPLDLSFGLH